MRKLNLKPKMSDTDDPCSCGFRTHAWGGAWFHECQSCREARWTAKRERAQEEKERDDERS